MAKHQPQREPELENEPKLWRQLNPGDAAITLDLVSEDGRKSRLSRIITRESMQRMPAYQAELLESEFRKLYAQLSTTPIPPKVE